MYEIRIGNGFEFTSLFFNTFAKAYENYQTTVRGSLLLGARFGYIEIRNESDQAIQRTNIVRGQEVPV